MTKIFEALSRSGGEITNVAMPALGGNGARLERVPEPERPAPRPPALGPVPAIPPSGPRTLPLELPPGSPLFPFDGSHVEAGEHYRIVRTRIVQHPGQPRLIMFSSPAPGDGKTVTAINTAAALALKSEVTALLVDTDLRRSTVTRSMGLPETPGLADVLAGQCTLDEALIRCEQLPSLYVLPAGNAPLNPAELLDCEGWPRLCERLRSRFDYTLLDAPPIAALADYDLIQTVSDALIVVVRPDHTPRGACNAALAGVPRNKLMGLVVNCSERWFLSTRQEHYYY